MAIKQVNRIYSDFDLSFAANPVTGDISKKTDANAVKQSIKTLVLTRFTERPFQPRLGSPIYGLLFENIDVVSANRLQLELEILIEKYEDEHYPIEAPDPIEAIKFRMEQMGMDNNDLAEIIGYKSRVSEIFSRKRKLSLKMIKNLHEKLKIPYESLIADY